jgi:hypothetical protein
MNANTWGTEPKHMDDIQTKTYSTKSMVRRNKPHEELSQKRKHPHSSGRPLSDTVLGPCMNKHLCHWNLMLLNEYGFLAAQSPRLSAALPHLWCKISMNDGILVFMEVV